MLRSFIRDEEGVTVVELATLGILATGLLTVVVVVGLVIACLVKTLVS